VTELHFLTIAEASALYRSKKLSPVELTTAYLDRIGQFDAELFSFITPTPEIALREARRAETELMEGRIRGPMHGIPYCLKDVIETAGIRTTGQSRSLANYKPKQDAAVVTRLREGGGILLGKNTTFEFAHGGPAWDVLAPPAHNPWNPRHHSSGSSSGTAVAIAAGFAPAGLGTDTGGSVRFPAAVCGIVGLKPTYGRVSRRGVIPNCFSHDHVGPLAWNAQDAALVLSVIAGHDAVDPSSADLPVPEEWGSLCDGSLKGLTIGVPYHWFEQEAPCSAEVRSAFDQAMSVMSAVGAKIVPIKLPSLQTYSDVKKTIAMADLFTIHSETLRAAPHLLGESLRYRIQCGALIRAEDYIRATRRRAELARLTQSVFRTVDLIATPTAEPAGLLEPEPNSAFFSEAPITTPFNVTGNPALTMCNGFSDHGMPLSVQIVGRHFDETTVLRVGHVYELVTPWRQRRPELAAA
jgi:aspartyl-tRNA(Asn)/glutamyl-tRNA(Gln) amidotransferase subunit A